MKKIYLIEITGSSRKGIWYTSKFGAKYEAELACKSCDHQKGQGIIVFEVNPCQWVHLIDCKIISERIVEEYKKIK